MNRLLLILLAKKLIATLVRLVVKSCTLKGSLLQNRCVFSSERIISSVGKMKLTKKCLVLKVPRLYGFHHKLLDAIVSISA